MSLSAETRGKIDLAVSNVAASFSPDVAYIRYAIGEDWSQDPAVFFRVVFADNLSRDRRRELSSELMEALRCGFDFNSLGLRSYQSCRTAAEQAASKDPEWAAAS